MAIDVLAAEPGSTDVVEVRYAWPEHAWQAVCPWSHPISLAQVLDVTGFHLAHPGWDISTAGVGVNGRLASLDTLVHAGDRVEIYRPLTFDPMVSRRRRAAHKARKLNGGEKHEQRDTRN